MIKKVIIYVIQKLGYDIIYYRDKKNNFPLDFESRHIEIIEKVAPYTLTGSVRIHALKESVQYILRNDIKGDFLECGVYKAGSMMTIALTLMTEGVRDRELYLFDTFEGMSKPTESDVNVIGKVALNYEEEERKETYASLNEVKKVVFKTGYDRSKIHFVKGKVEDTLPDNKINKIAILRLDTDYYESTKAEFEFLYPKLSVNGVLIVDDYGVWKGAKKATDEYLGKIKSRIFLSRINPLGAIIGIKTQ